MITPCSVLSCNVPSTAAAPNKDPGRAECKALLPSGHTCCGEGACDAGHARRRVACVVQCRRASRARKCVHVCGKEEWGRSRKGADPCDDGARGKDEEALERSCPHDRAEFGQLRGASLLVRAAARASRGRRSCIRGLGGRRRGLPLMLLTTGALRHSSRRALPQGKEGEVKEDSARKRSGRVKGRGGDISFICTPSPKST